MIRCYCDPPSVEPGEDIRLHVSVTSGRYKLRLFQQRESLKLVSDFGDAVFDGEPVPDGNYDEDWGWPVHQLQTDESWESGAYIIMAGEVDEGGNEHWPDLADASGEAAKALVVLRSLSRKRELLYKVSWFTLACYNWTGGGSLYSDAVWSNGPMGGGYRVSWRRPGVGTGGFVAPSDPPDVHYSGSRRQTFAHWDAPFLEWLYRSGYQFDVATDLDVHSSPELLEGRRLVLSVGHDEYWTSELRTNLERYRDLGGNIAFLSGNTCCFHVYVEPEHGLIMCPKSRGRESEYVWAAHASSEEAITGVSYFNAGGWWDERRPPVGYQVNHRGHWAFEDIAGDVKVIGATCEPPLVGYECDGTLYSRRESAVVAAPGRPHRNVAILGIAHLGEGWVTHSHNPAATITTYTDRSGGIVFTGGTTDWPIAVGRDADVEQVTRNVLRYLTTRSLRVIGPAGGLHDGRERLVEGETVSFHVDLADLVGQPAEILWRVAHGDEAGDWMAGGIIKEVTAGLSGRYQTVSVLVRTPDGSAVGFGSKTLEVIGRREGATARLRAKLRSAASPSGPPGSFTMQEGPVGDWLAGISETNAGIIARALTDGSDLITDLDDDP